jgi:hypothetical protein
MEIHMMKYSRFGISFRRDFLVSLGANPVFYIANNSPVFASTLVRLDHLADRIESALKEGKVVRSLYFDIYAKVIIDVLWALDSLAHDYQSDLSKGATEREADRSAIIRMMRALASLTGSEMDQIATNMKGRQGFVNVVKGLTEFI